MMVRFFAGLLALPWLALAAAAAEKEEDQCSVYLAESSTSSADEPRWGLFAGKRLEEDMVVGNPEIAIQTFNMVGNARTQKEAEEEEETSWTEEVVDFFEQFIWVPDASAGKFELKEGRTVSAISGAGVLGSYNAELTNSDWSHRPAYYRPPIGEEPGVAHVGRGAYSNFFDVTLKVKHTIPVGMEIFVDYGENYEQEESKGDLTRKDFDRIDTLVDRIIEFYDEFEGEMTPEAKKDIYSFLIKDVVGAAAGARKGRQISQLLPSDPEGLVEMKKRGGSFMVNKSPDVVRDEEWLKTNGLCVDNIKMGASTIPHAGRGAFASRPIKKGGLVSPVPLVHLPDKKFVDMHEIGESVDEEDTPIYFRASDDVTGQQLLVNYCFGHPESSMLFFPTGSVSAYINHNSKPNAKVVWSSHAKHHAEWLNLSLKDLLEEDNQYIGLLFEIVATRNIKEGEEVFIDYGKEWEKAWNEHVKTWNEKVKKGEIDSKWPTRALDMNAQYKSEVYKTPAELEKDPYPENVKLTCFLVVEEAKDDEEEEQSDTKKRRWTKPVTGKTVYDTEHLFECKVLERLMIEEDGPMPYNYTILWSEGTEEETVVDRVPHEAMVFVDEAGTSDQFVQDAFRHYIGIPDDIFPKGAWRDLA